MKRSVASLALALFAPSFVIVSCGETTIPVLSYDREDATATSDAFPPGADAADGAGTSDDARTGDDGSARAAYCAGSGPPVLLQTTANGTTMVCPGDLAAVAFRYALCTCDGYVSNLSLTTDAFDGSQGPYQPANARVGGSVGTNGAFDSTGKVTIGGSLWVSNTTDVTLSAATAIMGELHSEGRVSSGQKLTVGTDAWLARGAITSGDLTIVGTLRMPSTAAVSVGGTSSIGATVRDAVSVPPPCDCAPEDTLDVASFVESYRTNNDNAAIALDPRAFANVTAPLTTALPCGRIFLTRIGTNAPVHLTIQGRTAIFVAGDLSSSSDFVIDVPVGSELDLFVEGNVVTNGAFRIGSIANPAKGRLYVGGSGTVNLQSASQLAGNLYAPHAGVVLGTSPTVVYGAIFAKRISVAGDLTIHFDEEVLKQGSVCAPPVTPCTTCRDCANQACNSGTCGGCVDSTQCCAPLVCRGGVCTGDVQ